MGLPAGGCEALYAVGPGDIAPTAQQGGSVPLAVIVGAVTGLHVVAVGSPVAVGGRMLPQLPTRSSQAEVLAAVTGGGRSHKLRPGDQVTVGRVQLRVGGAEDTGERHMQPGAGAAGRGGGGPGSGGPGDAGRSGG